MAFHGFIEVVCATILAVSNSKMGQNESSFRKTYAETVSELSSVQLSEIHRLFEELYAKSGGSKGAIVDREAFSKCLNLPVTVGDRLFDAFDKKKVRGKDEMI